MRQHQSLTALRAFEAVARLRSFSAAAEELRVTRPAISKQVALLESDMGCALLTRLRKEVELTPGGNDLYLALKQAFELIHSTTQAVSRRAKQGQHLRVLACRDFASSWLASHVGTFLVANPGISLEITSEKSGTFRLDEDFDFRIFCRTKGDKVYAGFEETHLCHWIDMLVCTESFATSYLYNGHKACDAPYLVNERYDIWEEYCARAGIDSGGLRRHQTRFDETTLCLSVAASGGGMTIGDSFLALPAIRTGELIVPYKIGLVCEDYYGMFKPLGRSATPASRKFEAWLHGAVKDHEAMVFQVLAEKGIRVIEHPDKSEAATRMSSRESLPISPSKSQRTGRLITAVGAAKAGGTFV
ncbi:MAG: LysR family transcriptional regulator [Mesorhizobium sp.]|nr:MAG: LysR family transcriptional regulator [Mesorhizobium sp.]